MNYLRGKATSLFILCLCAVVGPVQCPAVDEIDGQIEIIVHTTNDPSGYRRDLDIYYKGMDTPKELRRFLPPGLPDRREESKYLLGIPASAPYTPYLHYWGPSPGPDQPSMEADATELESVRIVDREKGETALGTYIFREAGLNDSTVTVGPELDFLETVRVDSIRADPYEGFAIRWAPVPRAVGYQVKVRRYGPYATWKNSNENWLALGSDKALRTGVLLRDTSCNFPAGIFQGKVYVDVMAVSKEVRSAGPIPVVAYAESLCTVLVGTDF